MCTFLLVFFSWPLMAAIPPDRGSADYVLPDDLTAVTRGSVTVCQSRRADGGRRGLSFMQLENSLCPEEPRKAVGWDRPEVEPISPGIPFQDQGIER